MSLAILLGVACSNPPNEPVSSMTVADRTIIFEASSIHSDSAHLSVTYEGHSPAAGQPTATLSVFITAAGDGVKPRDYVCSGPNNIKVTVLDQGTEYLADATKGYCVVTVIYEETVRESIDVVATVVSAANVSLDITGHIDAIPQVP